MMNTNLIPRLTRSLIIVAFALALCAAAEMGRAQTPAGAVAAAPVAAAATPLPAEDVAAIKYDPADYHPGKPYQAKQTTPATPKKTVVLARGLRDDAKTQHKITVAVPAGSAIEILEDNPAKSYCVIKYNGEPRKLGRELRRQRLRVYPRPRPEGRLQNRAGESGARIASEGSPTNKKARIKCGLFSISGNLLAPRKPEGPTPGSGNNHKDNGEPMRGLKGWGGNPFFHGTVPEPFGPVPVSNNTAFYSGITLE